MNKYNIPGVKTFEYTKIIGIEYIEFGKNILIDDFVLIYATAKMKFGNYIHIASFTTMTGGEYLELGDFSGISHGSRILTGSDDFKDWGFANSTIDEKYRNVKRAPVIVGKFADVGCNCVVLPGVTIGEGASVGACSVVTRDLEPWGIYLGNKRVGWRNKDGIMKSYEQFLKDQAEKK
ncbi:MAG: acetyltransferase [Candidatus Fischerbacteria bacterium RBG_13_37_8]|uniref:Chloramphenicol acetyltransferase n=1 Tax=Candidatus Fischerbacteria bacterium RBG_13_37_8 TaxID=1817863 RepID=A0A1F5V884_9BACT|nr:MAG: acetyltransferase [Candidatus Fischerbacteria bacterium RBG_13_37_8]